MEDRIFQRLLMSLRAPHSRYSPLGLDVNAARKSNSEQNIVFPPFGSGFTSKYVLQ